MSWSLPRPICILIEIWMVLFSTVPLVLLVRWRGRIRNRCGWWSPTCWWGCCHCAGPSLEGSSTKLSILPDCAWNCVLPGRVSRRISWKIGPRLVYVRGVFQTNCWEWWRCWAFRLARNPVLVRWLRRGRPRSPVFPCGRCTGSDWWAAWRIVLHGDIGTLLDVISGFDHQMDQLPALEAAVDWLALHLLDVVLGVGSEKIIEEQLGLLQFIVDWGISACA